jgi:chemotaxis protein histidine kinase CheA
MNNPKIETVEIIHRRNRLKEKVVETGHGASGAGFIDPEAIRRAQAVIDNGQDLFIAELQKSLETLTALWKTMKKERKNEPGKIGEIHRLSNHIKDMAGTFGNTLMDEFGESLRDFSDQIDLSRKEHITIVQAHIDVMWIAFTKDIQDIDTEEAVELKTVLTRAIEKYASAPPVESSS